jgi:hypothetical protein
LVSSQFEDIVGFFIDKKPIANCTKRPGLAIICTIAVTNAATSTIGTAGVMSLHFFGNHEFIPIRETHLMLALQRTLLAHVK